MVFFVTVEKRETMPLKLFAYSHLQRLVFSHQRLGLDEEGVEIKVDVFDRWFEKKNPYLF